MNIRRRDFLRGASSTGALALLVACSPSAPPGASPATPGAQQPAPTQAQTSVQTAVQTGAAQRRGGQVIVASYEPAHLLTLIGGGGSETWASNFVFDGLTRPNAQMEFVPALAESWTMSPDGTKYTFKLRSGVKWHDGQDVTSEDVRFTWETLLNPKLPGRNTSAATSFQGIAGAAEFAAGSATSVAGIATPDPSTIGVELTHPYAPFLALAGTQFIFPKHYVGSVPVEAIPTSDAMRKPIGTGPFKFVEWTPNEAITLEANPSYWDGAPNLDRVILRSIADPTTTPSLLKSGAVDVVGLGWKIEPNDVAQFASDANFKVSKLGGIFSTYVEFNLANPIFQDVRVRQALVHGFDRAGFTQSYYQGSGRVVNAAVPPTSWAYTEPTTQYPFDPAKAKDLLGQAGWTPGGDGILQKDGQRFSIEMIVFDVIAGTYPVPLQRAWKEIGVELKLTTLAFGALFGRLLAGNFDVAGYEQTVGDYYDPSRLVDTIVATGGSRGKYSNPKVDTLLADARSSLDQAVRKSKYAELWEIVAQDVPHFWISFTDDNWATKANVKLADMNTTILQHRYVRDWALTG